MEMEGAVPIGKVVLAIQCVGYYHYMWWKNTAEWSELYEWERTESMQMQKIDLAMKNHLIGLQYIECLLCVRHYAKYFLYVESSIPRNSMS